MSTEIAQCAEQYLGFTLKGLKSEALSFLNDLADSKKFTLLQMFHILSTAQQNVGTLWASSAITVTDEHFTTEVTQEAIDTLSTKLKVFRPSHFGSALFANFVEGEYHTVGLKMFAQLLKADGWEVQFFPSQFNVASLFRYLDAKGRRFDLICCSVTMEFNVDDLKGILKILRTNIRTRKTKIVVGSQLFQQESYVDRMIDDETKEPLADCLAKDFDSGIDYARRIVLS